MSVGWLTQKSYKLIMMKFCAGVAPVGLGPWRKEAIDFDSNT